jgi:bifunctional ADP-heptose synthase (sugar kinase/adenylyltransferase)
VDVSGAGDSLLAIGSLTLASGHDLYETALMGSIAAGVQVSRRGNVPIEVHELEQTINEIFL